MKRTVSFIIIFSIMFSLLSTGITFGDTKYPIVDRAEYLLNGSNVLESTTMEMLNGGLYITLQNFITEFKYEGKWDDKNKILTIKSDTVTISIKAGSTDMIVNNVKVSMGKRTLLFDEYVRDDSNIKVPVVEVFTQLGFKFKYLGYNDSKPGYYAYEEIYNGKLVIKRSHRYEINGTIGNYSPKDTIENLYEWKNDSWMGLVIDRKVKAIPLGMGRIFADDENDIQIPVLVLCDFLGYKRSWDANTKRVTISARRGNVTFEIGNKVVSTDEGNKTLQFVPHEKEGLPYIPVEAVKEVLGISYEVRKWQDMYTTTWDADRDIIRYFFSYYLFLNLEPYQLGDNVVDYSYLPKGYMLADNKEFVEYMEKNHGELDKYGDKKYIVNGLNQGMEDKLCSHGIFAFDNGHPIDPQMNYIQAYDETKNFGHYRIDIRNWSLEDNKDVLNHLFKALAGENDGKEIYDKFYEEVNTKGVAGYSNKWIKTKSNREFQIVNKENIKGMRVLIRKPTFYKDFANPLLVNTNFVNFMKKNYPKKYYMNKLTVDDPLQNGEYKKSDFIYDPSGKFFQDNNLGYISVSTDIYQDKENAIKKNRDNRYWSIHVYKMDSATKPILNEILKTLFGEKDAKCIMDRYDYVIKNKIYGEPYNSIGLYQNTPSNKSYSLTYYKNSYVFINVTYDE